MEWTKTVIFLGGRYLDFPFIGEDTVNVLGIQETQKFQQILDI